MVVLFLALEPTELPSFVVGLSNVMARTGQKVRLECSIVGLPFPTVTWLHNSKLIKETRDIKVLFVHFSADEVIHLTLFPLLDFLGRKPIFPNHFRSFSKRCWNVPGRGQKYRRRNVKYLLPCCQSIEIYMRIRPEETKICILITQGRLPTETSDSELASDMEPVKPVIQQPLKNVSLKEGDKVRMDCVIVAQPEPEVKCLFRNLKSSCCQHNFLLNLGHLVPRRSTDQRIL